MTPWGKFDLWFPLTVSRAAKKKRGSTRGRVNRARASQSLNLTKMRKASLKAASQSLKTPSQRLRSRRKKRCKPGLTAEKDHRSRVHQKQSSDLKRLGFLF